MTERHTDSRQAETAGQRKDAKHKRECRIETETLNENKKKQAKDTKQRYTAVTV